MKGRKRSGNQHPGMETLVVVNKGHKKGQQQVQKQDTPVFSYLDQHLPQMGLNVIATDQEGNGKQ